MPVAQRHARLVCARGICMHTARAHATQVVHDAYSKRPLVWLRTYHGTISAGQTLHNTRPGVDERPTRLLRMHGEDAVDIADVGRGQIVAALGMKHTRTGDTLLLSPPTGLAAIRLPDVHTPTPVFFTAIEVRRTPSCDAMMPLPPTPRELGRAARVRRPSGRAVKAKGQLRKADAASRCALALPATTRAALSPTIWRRRLIWRPRRRRRQPSRRRLRARSRRSCLRIRA